MLALERHKITVKRIANASSGAERSKRRKTTHTEIEAIEIRCLRKVQVQDKTERDCVENRMSECRYAFDVYVPIEEWSWSPP